MDLPQVFDPSAWTRDECHVWHEHLVEHCMIGRPQDFEPSGRRVRESADCSCGCKFYLVLAGGLGGDWGVCANPKSLRCGLLTFEHQGCPHYEHDTAGDDLLEAL